MKKLLTATLCILLSIVFITGCVTINFTEGRGGVSGSGNMETFTLSVGEITDITEIRVELLCNIVFQSASSSTATLQIQPNLMEYITVQETGGILTVRSSRTISSLGSTNTPVLTVSSPSLTRISHTGAGTITTEDIIAGDSFSLSITGAASGNVRLDVQNLSVSLAGAGDLTLSGTADTATISLAGAGRLAAFELQTRVASIDLAGAGTVRISCSETLNVSAGGVGTVEYRGSPSVEISRGGLVTVRQVN